MAYHRDLLTVSKLRFDPVSNVRRFLTVEPTDLLTSNCPKGWVARVTAAAVGSKLAKRHKA